jgi:hypothetical protein
MASQADRLRATCPQCGALPGHPCSINCPEVDVLDAIEAPANMAEFEAHVMADTAPAVCMVPRETFRQFFRYVRRLERELQGSFF